LQEQEIEISINLFRKHVLLSFQGRHGLNSIGIDCIYDLVYMLNKASLKKWTSLLGSTAFKTDTILQVWVWWELKFPWWESVAFYSIPLAFAGFDDSLFSWA